MSTLPNVMETLQQFKDLLVTEKEALIKNDSAKVVAIVEEKQLFLEILGTLDSTGLNKEDVEKAVEEIKEQQQTNLLLTQQALQYQETVMDAITKGVKKSSSTYSKKGNYSSTKQANIIDQSL